MTESAITNGTAARHPPSFFGTSVFHVDAGGGGPAAGFQWPDFFSASATSFGM